MKCHILLKQIQQLAKPLASIFLKKAIKKKNQNPKSRAKHPDIKNFQKLKLYLSIMGREWRRIRAFRIHSKKGLIF